MRKIEVEIKGQSPYLMHKFGEDEADIKGKKSIAEKDYASEVEKALYRSPEGEIYVPSAQIKGCLIEAGKNFKVAGKGKSNYSKLFGAFLIVEPDTIPMVNQEWITDARAVVIQRARIIRYRPKFMEWGLKFTLTIMEDEIPVETVKNALDHAGNYVGIGDFRPQKKGSFGRFIVTSFKEVIN